MRVGKNLQFMKQNDTFYLQTLHPHVESTFGAFPQTPEGLLLIVRQVIS